MIPLTDYITKAVRQKEWRKFVLYLIDTIVLVITFTVFFKSLPPKEKILYYLFALVYAVCILFLMTTGKIITISYVFWYIFALACIIIGICCYNVYLHLKHTTNPNHIIKNKKIMDFNNTIFVILLILLITRITMESFAPGIRNMSSSNPFVVGGILYSIIILFSLAAIKIFNVTINDKNFNLHSNTLLNGISICFFFAALFLIMIYIIKGYSLNTTIFCNKMLSFIVSSSIITFCLLCYLYVYFLYKGKFEKWWKIPGLIYVVLITIFIITAFTVTKAKGFKRSTNEAKTNSSA
jgi:hypothetical protein